MRIQTSFFRRILVGLGSVLFLAIAGSCSKSYIRKDKITMVTHGLDQHATLFFPPTGKILTEEHTQAFLPIPHKRPAIILLHGGFAGDADPTSSVAEKFAEHGFITIVPTYRGEKRRIDGLRSEGNIEFCSGEVDDAQSALTTLKTREDVDPNRIGVIGFSHGGCIALRLAIREPTIRAVVTVSAPVAAEPVVWYLLTHPYNAFFFNAFLGPALENYIKGSPDQVPSSYAARSPLFAAYRLTMPVMLIHGGSDHVVPTQNVCWLAQALEQSGRSVKERWLDTDGTEQESPKKLCHLGEHGDIDAILDAPRTELWISAKQDHIYYSRTSQAATYEKAFQFFIQELGLVNGSD